MTELHRKALAEFLGCAFLARTGRAATAPAAAQDVVLPHPVEAEVAA